MNNKILEKREFMKKYWIQRELKDILYRAKKGHNCKNEICELMGILKYMRSVDDINEKTWNRITHLVVLIEEKYHCY